MGNGELEYRRRSSTSYSAERTPHRTLPRRLMIQRRGERVWPSRSTRGKPITNSLKSFVTEAAHNDRSGTPTALSSNGAQLRTAYLIAQRTSRRSGRRRQICALLFLAFQLDQQMVRAFFTLELFRPRRARIMSDADL